MHFCMGCDPDSTALPSQVVVHQLICVICKRIYQRGTRDPLSVRIILIAVELACLLVKCKDATVGTDARHWQLKHVIGRLC